jgi:hypothetical protein
MMWCWRTSPFVAAALLLVRAHTLFGLGRAAATATRVTRAPSPGVVVAHLGGALVSEFFAWLYLLIGVTVAYGVLHCVIEEIKLRRDYDSAASRLRWQPGLRRSVRRRTGAGLIAPARHSGPPRQGPLG